MKHPAYRSDDDSSPPAKRGKWGGGFLIGAVQSVKGLLRPLAPASAGDPETDAPGISLAQLAAAAATPLGAGRDSMIVAALRLSTAQAAKSTPMAQDAGGASPRSPSAAEFGAAAQPLLMATMLDAAKQTHAGDAPQPQHVNRQPGSEVEESAQVSLMLSPTSHPRQVSGTGEHDWRPDTLYLGREQAAAHLLGCFLTDNCPRAVCLYGSAGVGKSALACSASAEYSRLLSSAQAPALVLHVDLYGARSQQDMLRAFKATLARLHKTEVAVAEVRQDNITPRIRRSRRSRRSTAIMANKPAAVSNASEADEVTEDGCPVPMQHPAQQVEVSSGRDSDAVAGIVAGITRLAGVPGNNADEAGVPSAEDSNCTVAARRVLLILDNAEGALHGALPEQVACADLLEKVVSGVGVDLLVTSRQPLVLPRQSVVNRGLAGLDKAASVPLVCCMSPGLNKAEAREVAGLCSGLPRLLRLVSAAVGPEGRLTMQDVRRLTLLASDSAFVTVRALPLPLQRSLVHLSAFAAHFAREAAAAVMGFDAQTPLTGEMLQELYNFGLVRHHTNGSGWILDHAAKAASADFPDMAGEARRAQDRHTVHTMQQLVRCCNTYEAGNHESARQAAADLEAEVAAAITRLAAPAPPPAKLAAEAASYARLLGHIGNLGLPLTQHAEAWRNVAASLQDHQLRTDALHRLADVLLQQKKSSQAMEAAQLCLATCRAAVGGEAGNAHRAAHAMLVLANCHIAKERHEEAATLLQEGLVLLQAHPSDSTQELDPACFLDLLAASLYHLGQFSRAEGLRREELALRLKHEEEGCDSIAATMQDVGDCLQAQGQYSEAAALYREAANLRMQWLGEAHALTLCSEEKFNRCQQQEQQQEQQQHQQLPKGRRQVSR